MGEQKELGQEIVEVYRQPEYREVVEVYSRPLPGYRKGREEELPAPRKNRRKGVIIFLICFVLVVLMAVGAVLLAQKKHEVKPNEGVPQKESSEEISIPAYPTGQGVKLPIVREHGEMLTAQEIYQQVNPAVVTVMVQVKDKMGVGTGVIFREDGYVITNEHVLAGASECMVTLADGYSYPANYVASDVANDLGILKIDLGLYPGGMRFPAAEFGDSDGLVVGDKVYAIGNPLGFELRGTLTDGIVSAINRDVWVDNRNMTLIQTNAALNSGNSGGPLINCYGQVIGINTLKIGDTASTAGVEGIGFAIPSSTVQQIVNQLMEQGYVSGRPGLGFSGTALSNFYQSYFHLPQGYYIEEVSVGTPADQLGIQPGDVLVSIMDTPVSTDDDIAAALYGYNVGDVVTIIISRSGRYYQVELELIEATG